MDSHCSGYGNYEKEEERMDVVGQNGNTGEHYLVETVARAMCGPDADEYMYGLRSKKQRWEIYIRPAMRVVDELVAMGILK